MSRISRQTWLNYTRKLSAINQRVADEVVGWLEAFGVDEFGNIVPDLSNTYDKWDRNFYQFCANLTQAYGDASGALSAAMYDAIAEIEGVIVPAAEIAETATLQDVYKTVDGVLKTSRNVNEMSGAVSRLVKKTGADTTLMNAQRDGAQFAWIPVGDTCAFCLALAANGWVYQSKRGATKHAEHIHSNCDCTYAVRFSKDTKYEGYDPQKYMDDIDEAAEAQGLLGGNTSVEDAYWGAGQQMNPEVINAVRRENYAKNKAKINEQKRIAYGKRVEELNNSAAEEIKI